MFGLLGAPSTLETGLLHSWSLEGNSNDALGTGNGTDTAVTYVAGKLGQCASFDGTTSKIQTAVDGPLGASSRSVGLWVKKTAASNRIAFGYGVQVAAQSFDILYNATGLCVYTTDTYGGLIATSIGVWHHFVATYDGVTVRTYLDGVAGTPWVKALNTVSSIPIRIGTGVHTSFQYWDGLIDEPAMWNRALTAAEVTALYASGSPGRCPW